MGWLSCSTAPNASRGYGLYFTIYLGSGAISPSLYGLVGDAMGL